MQRIKAIILTYNESIHIKRCIESVRQFSSNIMLVDSFSTDDTVEIAEAMGVEVKKHKFVNYSTQFNWAIEHAGDDYDWLFRIDADELVDKVLATNIVERIDSLNEAINGVMVDRYMTFMGQSITKGGLFPVKVIRLWRKSKGVCESRWMDEHILVDGDVLELDGKLIDDNLNGLTWWTEKHNKYASREAIDLLNIKYNFITYDDRLSVSTQAGKKRWLKRNIYNKLPKGLRALVYFLYRYVFALGFLDGSVGFAFHFLQGFWYRYLVDMKVDEVESHMAKNSASVEESIKAVLGIDVRQ